jgi:flagellar assembly protein FliH
VIKGDSAAVGKGLALRAFHMNDVMDEAREKLAGALDTVSAARQTLAAANEKLSNARKEAEAILARARSEVAGIQDVAREAGRQEGFQAGYEEGRQAGRAEALEAARLEFAENQQSLIDTCRSMIETISRERANWLAAARQDVIELAEAIARRVVHHVGQRDREVVLANLEEAVRLVGVRSVVTIAVNPADAEAARVFAQSLLDLKEHWEHIQVAEEPEVSPGGCRVQWGSGSVDATLETQLDRIAAELKGF